MIDVTELPEQEINDLIQKAWDGVRDVLESVRGRPNLDSISVRYASTEIITGIVGLYALSFPVGGEFLLRDEIRRSLDNLALARITQGNKQ